MPDLPPFEVRDLPVDTLDALGAIYGVTWAEVIVDPGARAGLLSRIVAAVAELTKIDLPAVVTGADAMAALEHLVMLVPSSEA